MGGDVGETAATVDAAGMDAAGGTAAGGTAGTAAVGGAAGTAAVDGEATLGYEQARAALDEVVHRLETGGLSLEESLALWERGERLADVCQAWLDGARRRLDTALAPPADPGRTGA
jgi:exodeoxyribonuclease VII small subunit